MTMQRKALIASFLLLRLTSYSLPLHADDQSVYLSVGSDVVKYLMNNPEKSRQVSLIKGDLKQLDSAKDVSVIKIGKDKLDSLSEIIHEKFNRCGGFFVHESVNEAQKAIADLLFHSNKDNDSFNPSVDYSITEQNIVTQYLPQLQVENIKQTILKLSQFHNRYYQSETGIEALNWIKSNWQSLANGRNDVKVDFFHHNAFQQPSVILTITGTTHPEEIVIVGGHADSISGFWNRSLSRAPGADDNASGISTLTEVLRVLMANDYRPQKTVQFMAYAAEEVGLLGSNDIANSYKSQHKNVVGVLQFDMTNQKAGKLDIVMMSDYTDKNQNSFIGKLVDEYVKVSWGYSQCGYACSDHASWTKNGFSSSIPFETTMELSNKNIHTPNDTLDVMGGTADHSFKFAKLGLSYVVEMAK